MPRDFRNRMYTKGFDRTNPEYRGDRGCIKPNPKIQQRILAIDCDLPAILNVQNFGSRMVEASGPTL